MEENTIVQDNIIFDFRSDEEIQNSTDNTLNVSNDVWISRP